MAHITRPNPARPDTVDDPVLGIHNPGVTWRYIDGDGELRALIYASTVLGGHLGSVGGLSVGTGLPPLPLTRDADAIGDDGRLTRDVDCGPLSYAQVAAEIEAHLQHQGHTLTDRPPTLATGASLTPQQAVEVSTWLV